MFGVKLNAEEKKEKIWMELTPGKKKLCAKK